MKEKRIITILLVSILSIILLLICSKVGLPQLTKLKGSVNLTNQAVFDTGERVNVKMKALANSSSDLDIDDYEEQITTIKKSSTAPTSQNMKSKNIVSSSNSDIPIYMWYDNGTLYWYSTDSTPYLNEDVSYMFNGLTNLNSIPEFNNFDSTLVTFANALFQGCKKLTSINLSNFNTSNIVTMGAMFSHCESLKNLDLSNFNTSKVTTMTYMFSYCKSLTSLNLSNFNTKNVTKMNGMFSDCNLTTLNLNNFNTSNVTNMSNMFYGNTNLITLNVNSFDISKVTNMTGMFYNCYKLDVDNININNFNINSYKATFIEGYKFNEKIRILANSTNKGIDKAEDKIKKIKRTSTKPDFSSITDENIVSILDDEEPLNIYIYAWYDENSQTLYWYSKDSKPYLNGNASNMFLNLKVLDEIDLNNFDTSKVTSMSGVFQNCENLTVLDLSSWNTNNVTNASTMFCGCKNLKDLNLENMDTSNITRMPLMFYGCSNLKTIYVSNKFITTNVTDSSNMFDNCTKLIGEKGTAYNKDIVDKTYARIDQGSTLPGYFSQNKNGVTIKIKGNISILNKPITKSMVITVLNDNTIKVISNGQEIEDETKLKTGDILQYNSNEYEIAILGDTNKDGSITGSDITQTYSAYKRAITLTGVQRYASDTNEDGNITGSDITKMYSIYKGKVY